jgi:hypothetical protein
MYVCNQCWAVLWVGMVNFLPEILQVSWLNDCGIVWKSIAGFVWKSIVGYLIADNPLNKWVLCFFVSLFLSPSLQISLCSSFIFFLGFRGERTTHHKHAGPTNKMLYIYLLCPPKKSILI